MDSSSILILIQNAALLLSMLFFYDFFTRNRSFEHLSLRYIYTGITVGTIGVVILLTPWQFQPGIIFDTRSVLLSISGLFLGPVPTLIAMTIMAGLRAFLGGSGMMVGIAEILASGLIGIMWRYCFHKESTFKITAKELYLFGLIVHGVMLGIMLLFPKDIAVQVLSKITLPMLIIFPVVTVGLGSLFIRRMKQEQSDAAIQLSSSVYQNSSEAMSVTDASGAILTVNPAFTEITGYTQDEIIGKTHQILQSGRQDQPFYQAMWSEINTTGRWKGEIWNRRKSGEVYPEWLSINTIINDEGIPHRYIALSTDITQEKEFEEKIWQQTNFDSLTGLPNRRMFRDRLDQVIKKAQHSDHTNVLLLIELDHFKDVIDSYGHATGDDLVKTSAERLQYCIREFDTLARIGGDEFGVILGELDDLGVVERIIQNIRAVLGGAFQLDSESFYITNSIGIALYPDDAKSADTLNQCAGHALSSAKEQGGNCRHYYKPMMQEAAQNKRMLVKELRHSLTENQLSVYYQPIVDLSNDTIYKAEALLRWEHPSKGFISPADFIPIAEETGLIIEIGNWVFREAAKQVKSWRNIIHSEFQISVNKSPVQFRYEDDSLYEWFDFLYQLGLTGDSIVIEITEGLMMESSATVSSKLFALSDAGFQVALDDFGTGYSTISYLQKFDIDYLKIDQSFVRNLENDASNVALCESMIAMAHKLGIKVIAEGVETREQRDLLKAWGCDYAQGYLFSKPVPADEFEKLLADRIGIVTCM